MGCPQAGQVDPELVGASGVGQQADQGRGRESRQNLELGPGWLAGLMADHLPGPVGPVADQGQFDQAIVLDHDAFDQGEVDFARAAVLELLAQDGLGLASRGHDQDPGGAQIQAVHSLGLRVIGAGSGSGR